MIRRWTPGDTPSDRGNAKSRLRVLGYQEAATTSMVVYSPTPSGQVMNMFLSVGNSEGLVLALCDCKHAFYQGNDLPRKLYAKACPGTPIHETLQIVRLVRPLYGLDDAPKL